MSDILGDVGEFRSLAESARNVARLQRVYVEAVPPELASSSRIGWARGDVLCIIADNGATAAKLRQMPSRILRQMRQGGYEFNSMRIEVQVGQAPRALAYRRHKSLSPEAISAIDQALASVPDSPLKAALARLSRRR